MTRRVMVSLVILLGFWLVSSMTIVLADDDPLPPSTPSPHEETIVTGVVEEEPLLNHRVWLPVVYRNYCHASIRFTSIPPYGSFEDLYGQVECVEPADYRVAVYIYVNGGWWTKPYWARPTRPINPNGSWDCDVTTGGEDQHAIQFAAFVIPKGYSPPLASGNPRFMEEGYPGYELFAKSVARVFVERKPIYREIAWSGYLWGVKESVTPTGPDYNYFSDREEDVWVDDAGRLHLTITERGGRWYCTEVIGQFSLDHGRYVFRLASPVNGLDPNVVLGLFTWDASAPEYYYRELDIEFSRWGVPADQAGQYVVQPYGWPGRRYRFDMTGVSVSTHGFDWGSDSIFFQSLEGYQPFPGPVENEIASWTYSGGTIPPPGGNARLNLWLFQHTPPADGQRVEVVIDSFQFIPAE